MRAEHGTVKSNIEPHVSLAFFKKSIFKDVVRTSCNHHWRGAKLMKLLFLAFIAALPLTAFAYTFDDDVPANIKKQITNDMTFIGTIRADGARSTPLHYQIFGNVDGQRYVDFFEQRVTGVGMNDCGGGKAVACVIPFFDSSKIWLTQNYVRFDHPQVAKMMVVFHESRHTETQNGNWSHANCPTPFVDKDGNEIKSIWTGATLAGEPACDVTPFGSYGSSTIMLKNISKFCSNCTDKVKMDAGLYSDDQLKRITDIGARDQMDRDFTASN